MLIIAPALAALFSLSEAQGLSIRQANSTASSNSTGNALASCSPPPTLNAQYTSFSSGYANTCCVGSTSECFVRDQSTVPTAQQCTIPSCPDLRSGSTASMQGFEALDDGAGSGGGKLAGNASSDAGGGFDNAFPNATVVATGAAAPGVATGANLAACFATILSVTVVALVVL